MGGSNKILLMNNHFTVIVAGDKPDEIIKKYDSTMKVERYLVYKFLNAEEYRKQELEMYRTALENKDLPEDLIEGVKLRIEELETEDVLTFYTDLTRDLERDQETGDDDWAWSRQYGDIERSICESSSLEYTVRQWLV